MHIGAMPGPIAAGGKQAGAAEGGPSLLQLPKRPFCCLQCGPTMVAAGEIPRLRSE